ncbi:hypothetical protein MKW98_008456 [Papaver atlanticum]|uniref:Uncharacterized protein n=1 Tax=Papaver atlanticum TaxID=357466 RepID=A0AAD4XFH0_9MAGN|nr:hypothetical protein MKW98_008456 [Papaver atlanticum]
MSEIRRKEERKVKFKWKYERKRLREEIKKLKKESEEKDGRIQRLMENNSIKYDQNGRHMEASYNYLMMEHMREEQLRRQETELDDLIERTCRVEDETIEELQREVCKHP